MGEKTSQTSSRLSGAPAQAVRERVRLILPEPEILRTVGEESKQKATHRLSSKQLDGIIKAARRSKDHS